MSTLHHQVINSTGEVVGGGVAQPCSVNLHGWFFSNAGAATYEVDFYIPASVGNGGAIPALPSASGTKIFSIQVPAASSKEYFEDAGIYFKDGLFAICSNASLTGSVVYS